jgi:hypothetical protein
MINASYQTIKEAEAHNAEVARLREAAEEVILEWDNDCENLTIFTMAISKLRKALAAQEVE